MSAQRYADAEAHLRNAVRLNPAVGEGELSARAAARAHRQEGRSRPAARAVENAAPGGRGDVAAAAAAAGSGAMTHEGSCRCRRLAARPALQSDHALGAQTMPRRPRSRRPASRRPSSAIPTQLEALRGAGPRVLAAERLSARARRVPARREARAAVPRRRTTGSASRFGEGGSARRASPRSKADRARSRSTAAPTRTSARRWRRAATTARRSPSSRRRWRSSRTASART